MKTESIYNYTIYEMLYSVTEGKDFNAVFLHNVCIGKTIDNVVLFSDTVETCEVDENSKIIKGDIGFIFGDKCLIIKQSMNILVDNNIFSEEKHINVPNLFGINVVGQKIQDIKIECEETVDKICSYSEPVIKIYLDNGKCLKVTENTVQDKMCRII